MICSTAFSGSHFFCTSICGFPCACNRGKSWLSFGKAAGHEEAISRLSSLFPSSGERFFILNRNLEHELHFKFVY